MKRNTIFTVIFLISFLLVSVSSILGANLLNERMNRWHNRSLDRNNYLSNDNPVSEELRNFKSSETNFVDVRIGEESSPASFAQQYPDAVYFSNGTAIVVWEDDRNGDWDIYAQVISPAGIEQGGDFKLIDDLNSISERQPVITVNNSDQLVVVWSEEETSALYTATFSNVLALVSARQKINDNQSNNAINLPDVSALGAGGFVVVWEDNRSGSNIYAQIYNSLNDKVNNNFRVNQDISSPLRLSPAVSGDDGSNFAVVWEDYRDGEGDVYISLFNGDGTPLITDLKTAEASYEGSYQFLPGIGFLADSGYLTAWITDRDDKQGIYAQIVTTAGALQGSNFQLNGQDTDVCWDVTLSSSPAGGVSAVWVNFAVIAEINLQEINSNGTLAGSNLTISDPAANGERQNPAIALYDTTTQIVWMDKREISFDIYSHRLTSSTEKNGSNLKLNDDLSGSHQSHPDIATTLSGVVIVAFEDRHADAGDIYMQRVTSSGSIFGAMKKVNDDSFPIKQSRPAVAASGVTGTSVIVWEDSRTEGGFSGQNIFAQRFTFLGDHAGTNFIVNDDGSASAKSEPDAAMAANGSFAIVWIDERSGKKEIYLQLLNANGSTKGSNRKISSLQISSDNYDPEVGIRNDGSLVVSWTTVIGLNRVRYFQRLNDNGNAIGSNMAIAVDQGTTQILEAGLFVHLTSGDFFISYIDASSFGSAIKLLKYDSDGILVGGEVILSDFSDQNFQSLTLCGDEGTRIIATWTDTRSGIARAYLQIVREDGLLLGSNLPVSQAGTSALEKQPATVISLSYFVTTWVDNRTPGNGFDLYIASEQYSATAVDDNDPNLPKNFTLEQNYPNPFNPETIISYTIRKSAVVKLEVFNLLGQKVKTLVDAYQTAGNYQINWDGTDSYGNQTASGIYLYRLNAGDYATTRKMTLLK